MNELRKDSVMLALEESVNLDRLLHITGNDLSFALLLLQKANSANMDDLATAKRQEQEGKIDALLKTVHRLKGASQTICAVEIEACCTQLEKACLLDKEPASIKAHLERLEMLLCALHDTLGSLTCR